MPADALANPIALAALGVLLERPTHPYEVAGVLAGRGVPVNRGSLYDTVRAMTRAGWIEPLASERQAARPQRTPYALTEQGRAELVRRLDAQIRRPRREFGAFVAAVSHLGVLGPTRAAEALSERAERLAEILGEDERRLDEAVRSQAVPRLFVIEAEYALAMLRAERDWVLATVEDIATGRLAWPRSDDEHR